MQTLSEAQHHAATTGGMPQPELLGAGLWSLPMKMPGDFLTYSLAVVHIDLQGAVTIVDPGWGGDDALERVDAFLTSVGRGLTHIESIVITHSHPDHIGLADALRQVSGARLILHAREQESIDAGNHPDPEDAARRLTDWGVDRTVADTLLTRLAHASRGTAQDLTADEFVADGDLLPVRGERWRVIHTPGHTPGHICIADRNRRLLFSGDHVLPTVFPGIGLGAAFDGNPLAAYLDSLNRLGPFDDFDVVPGHGYRFRGLRGRRTDAANHARRRAREVAAALADDPQATTWDVASRLTWTGGWDQLVGGIMLYSALLQTDMYRDFVDHGGLEADKERSPERSHG